jgi:tRNA 5-methylaminomethyl-2-thiouridine biosynthesis bifunctional protein
VLDVAEALAGWAGRADAWFLDGFAPAANPQMWTHEVLALVAARSAPGARAATFTVAGQVRRGLAAAGFAVDKRPGHGSKRERPGGPPARRRRPIRPRRGGHHRRRDRRERPPQRAVAAPRAARR